MIFNKNYFSKCPLNSPLPYHSAHTRKNGRTWGTLTLDPQLRRLLFCTTELRSHLKLKIFSENWIVTTESLWLVLEMGFEPIYLSGRDFWGLHVYLLHHSSLNYAITEDDCYSVKISLSQLFPDVPSDKTIMSFDLDVIFIYFISCRFMTTSEEGCLFSAQDI